MPFTGSVPMVTVVRSGRTSAKTMFPVGKYPPCNNALSVRDEPTVEVVVVRLGLAAETIVVSGLVDETPLKVATQLYVPATGPFWGNTELTGP